MKKSIVLIPLPSLIKNSFVRSFVLSLSLSLLSLSPCKHNYNKSIKKIKILFFHFLNCHENGRM